MMKKGMYIVLLFIVACAVPLDTTPNDQEIASSIPAERMDADAPIDTSNLDDSVDPSTVDINDNTIDAKTIDANTGDQSQPDTSDPFYCETAEDCVPKECCHPTTCVQINAQDTCENPQMCTSVCMPCIACGCVDNRCQSETKEGCC
jgi:hypothetical protein